LVLALSILGTKSSRGLSQIYDLYVLRKRAVISRNFKKKVSLCVDPKDQNDFKRENRERRAGYRVKPLGPSAERENRELFLVISILLIFLGGEAAISGERGQKPLGPERRAGKPGTFLSDFDSPYFPRG
jgi:hypothetical protein